LAAIGRGNRAIAAVSAGQVLCLFLEGEANPDIPLDRILPGAVVRFGEAFSVPYAVGDKKAVGTRKGVARKGVGA